MRQPRNFFYNENFPIYGIYFAVIYIVCRVWLTILGCITPYRHGGGIGDPAIRKMAYFEGSVDPAYAGSKVRLLYVAN